MICNWWIRSVKRKVQTTMYQDFSNPRQQDLKQSVHTFSVYPNQPTAESKCNVCGASFIIPYSNSTTINCPIVHSLFEFVFISVGAKSICGSRFAQKRQKPNLAVPVSPADLSSFYVSFLYHLF